jgi:hypothetical protein
MSTDIYHNHHIIPRHAGGTDDPDNIARLTVSEHAEAHCKLYEEYGRWQDKIAYQCLSGIIGKEEAIRETIIQSNKVRRGEKVKNTKKMSEASGRRKHSLETRKKISKTKMGHKVSEETIKKMSGKNNHMYGKTHSPEVRKKISERMMGVKRGPYKPKQKEQL